MMSRMGRLALLYSTYLPTPTSFYIVRVKLLSCPPGCVLCHGEMVNYCPMGDGIGCNGSSLIIDMIEIITVFNLR